MERIKKKIIKNGKDGAKKGIYCKKGSAYFGRRFV